MTLSPGAQKIVDRLVAQQKAAGITENDGSTIQWGEGDTDSSLSASSHEAVSVEAGSADWTDTADDGDGGEGGC